MTAPARLALAVLGLLTTTTARLRSRTSRRLPKMRRIVSGWPAEGSASASAKTRGSPSTTTTPRGTRPCRRASTSRGRLYATLNYGF